MPTIRQLPVSLINKIAAGEVIERPASVVKELLENSIDAGATRIELSVEGGGMEMIRISDNGCGIAKDELLLAISPHATSKLVEADDLFDIRTLGFRGEALASIAEISHLDLRSRVAGSESGAELIVRGGEVEGPRDCASPVGTTMEIRHLFFNTPVRRKFLKSNQTEMGHVLEAFTRIALAHPQVHMVIISNGRTTHDLPATDRWTERIEAFFGTEVSDNLIRIDSADGEIRLHGYVVNPEVTRGNNRMQYLFLNGRYIRDRSLQHALGEAYRGLVMVGRFPVCFLNLEIPPSQVDVNVHPTKSEVRFVDGGEIYRRLLQTLRSKFLSSDLTAKVMAPAEEPESSLNQHAPFNDPWPKPASQPAWSNSLDSTPRSTPASRDSLLRWGHARGETVDLTKSGSVSPFRPFPSEGMALNSLLSRSSSPTVDFPFRDQTSPTSQPWEVVDATTQNGMPSSEAGMLNAVSIENRLDAPHTNVATSHLGFQIHNRYLVTQDDAGMVVIDQHALHERILYEQVRDRVLSRTMESQRLLIPEPVTLTGPEAAAALDARATLRQIGIEIEPFGGDTVLVTAYPAMLTKITPAEMLRQVLEPLMEAGKKPDARDLLEAMMSMMSCKAAIKAGDKLSAEEVTALLEQRHLFADTHHCPHGRPTALFFSREQLDKMFKRT
jgi:DNA mismatch repair protein MutL